jgi:nucleotide-binding universal stress UspA family protein
MGRIVVGVDGSEPSRAALQWAVDEACRRQAQLETVHVWQYPNVYATTGAFSAFVFDSSELEAAAKAELDEIVATVDASGLASPIIQTVVSGVPASVLLEKAQDADVLVVGSRGRGGFAGLLLGSVSQQLAHHAHCPLVIVPAPD